MSVITSNLLAYIFDNPSQPIARSLRQWMDASPRYQVFVETYRDKIRKKLRSARDEDGLQDVRCELATAYRLSLDKRFGIEYEKLPLRQQRGTDFTIAFRVSHSFNLEVTRMRQPRPNQSDLAAVYRKLAELVCEKLGQMQPQEVNVLTVVTDGVLLSAEGVVEAMKALQLRAERKDEAYFIERGYRDAREFLRALQRLSAILFDSVWEGATPPPFLLLWANPRAERPLPPDLKNALLLPHT